MATTKIQCLAVISANNTPLYLRSFGPGREGRDADARFHFIAHAALDVVEERTSSRSSEQYLGLLMTTEDVGVYGFQTSTRVKFLLMVTMSDAIVRDLDVITIFRAMHTSYLSHVSNPFHSLTAPVHPGRATEPPPPLSEANLPPGSKPIRSALFERRMEKIAGWTPPRDQKAAAPAAVTLPSSPPPVPVKE
ncbi:unnamed protein product [Parajaminaea phylloscopi]